MNQFLSDHRYIDVPIPAGFNAVSDPIEARYVERPVLLFTPASWITSHINAWASRDGSSWTRIWSTNVTQTHFLVSIAADQAMIMFTQAFQGGFRYYKIESFTDQTVERTVTLLLIDDWYDLFDAPFGSRSIRGASGDQFAKAGGKA